MTEAKSNVIQEVNRRKFIASAGIAAAGVAAGGVLGFAKPSRASGVPVNLLVNGQKITGPVAPKIEGRTTVGPVRAVAETLGAQVSWDAATSTVSVNGKAEGVASLPALPWPYKKLDPEVVRKAGYDAYREGFHCMGGSFKGIISILAREVGYPYTAIPVEMTYYGAGGVMGWATLCGAANGSSMAVNIVLGKENKDLGKVINELLGYYSITALPTALSNKYGEMGALPQSVAGSPLCHASVSNWCEASGFKSLSPERAERCARLTGDIAAKAVELLNQYAENNFTPVYKAPEPVTECGSCNTEGGLIENTRGKMNCTTCHEPHNQ